jgi:hypothetical protein
MLLTKTFLAILYIRDFIEQVEQDLVRPRKGLAL